MKFFPAASLCFALAIHLISVGCSGPEHSIASSDTAISAGGGDHGGGWCPMSALATCQSHCEQVATCAVEPFFPTVDVESCSFACADALITGDGDAREVVECLSGIENEHACCEVMGCAAGWMAPTPVATSPEPVLEPETSETTPDTPPEPAPETVVEDMGDVAPQHHPSHALCSDGSRFTTNGQGRAFCLFENMTVPEDADVKAYCHWLHEGYMGFHWPELQTPDGYLCPPPSREGTNGAGLSFCTVHELALPQTDSLEPFCEHLADGVFGYTWCLDPATTSCGAPDPIDPEPGRFPAAYASSGR